MLFHRQKREWIKSALVNHYCDQLLSPALAHCWWLIRARRLVIKAVTHRWTLDTHKHISLGEGSEKSHRRALDSCVNLECTYSYDNPGDPREEKPD